MSMELSPGDSELKKTFLVSSKSSYFLKHKRQANSPVKYTVKSSMKTVCIDAVGAQKWARVEFL